MKTFYLSPVLATALFWSMPFLESASAQVGTEPLLEVHGVLEPGDATLEDSSLVDTHTFEGQAGQTVTILLESQDFDTTLGLRDNQGNLIANNNDISGDNLNSAIIITLPADGTYRVLVANGYDAENQGRYALTVAPTIAGQPNPLLSATEVKKLQAKALLAQGIQQYRISQFREALQSWQSALDIYREIGDRTGEGAALGNLGIAYGNLGQYQRAIALFEQFLAISRDPGDRTREGVALGNLGNVYNSLGQYQRAIALFEQSLAISRDLGDRAREGVALGNLGNVYNSLGQYQRAIALFEQQLAITREIGDRQGEAALFSNLGAAFEAIGSFDKALEFYSEALSIQRGIGDIYGEASTLNNLAAIYDALGDIEQALEYYNQALAIRQQIGDRSGEAITINNIGAVYRTLGQFEQAIDLYTQALIIRREIGDRSGEASTLNNIGAVYNALGQTETALEFYNQTLAINREIGDRSGEATTLNNIGAAYDTFGRSEESINHYTQALQILQEIGDRPGEAITLNNIGQAHIADGETERGLSFFSCALEIFREVGDRSGEANGLSNIGRAYLALEQTETALNHFKQALLIFRETSNRSGEANTLKNLGQTYLMLGQTEEAAQSLREALLIFREIENRSSETDVSNSDQLYVGHAKTRSAFNTSLSMVKQSVAQPIDASSIEDAEDISIADPSIEMFRQNLADYKETHLLTGDINSLYGVGVTSLLLGQLFMTQEQVPDALEVFNGALFVFMQLADRYGEAKTLYHIAVAQKRINPDDSIEKLQRAVKLLLEIRGNVQRENRQPFLQAGIRRKMTVALVDLLIEQNQLERAFEWSNLATIADLADYARLINAKVVNPEAQTAIDQWNRKNQQLQNLRRQLPNNFSEERAQQMRDLESEVFQEADTIADQFPEVAELFESTPEEIDQLLANIPQGNIIIQPVLLTNTDNATNSIVLFLLSREQPLVVKRIHIDSKEFDDLVDQYRQQLRDWRDSKFAISQEKLYDLLIRPIESEIDMASPNQLSFILTGKLRYIPFETLYDSKTKRYLIEKYPINYRTRLSAKGENYTRQQNGYSQPRVLVLGNPKPFSPYNLPGTAEEAREIALLMPESEMWLGDQATLDQFITQAPRFPFLHLATHGCFESRGCSQLDMEPNTLLFADQQYNIADAALLGLNNTELVTLSACQTAQEADVNGKEISGLAYLFERAGAKSVIAGLWNVEDKSTKDIMVQFYQNLTQGMNKSEALRQAKLSHVQDHPFFWAPLVLIGEGR
ncbi:MAG: tetratricopeptide repeat protein [Pseudanabaenales cyanobacterium]|nr:tetratricopeptide repeat protein [Pseudanabaenales cyanobacterium]